jgi:hypothetical protein
MEADLDRDGKISFEEFTKMVENTDVSMSMTLGKETASSFPAYQHPGLMDMSQINFERHEHSGGVYEVYGRVHSSAVKAALFCRPHKVKPRGGLKKHAGLIVGKLGGGQAGRAAPMISLIERL